jgi:hypothetical protein
MLYVGHFSFTAQAEDEETPSHGVFTCVADAADVDAALETLRELVVRLKNEDDVLDGVTQVFLDSCVEVRSMPETGLMTYWVSWPHEETSSISTGLRWAEGDDAVGYAMLPDDDHDDEADHTHEAGDEAEGDDDADWEVDPFVEF